MTEKYQNRMKFLKELQNQIEEIRSLGPEDYGVVDDDVWSALMGDIEEDVKETGRAL